MFYCYCYTLVRPRCGGQIWVLKNVETNKNKSFNKRNYLDLNIYLLYLQHRPYNLFWYCVGSSGTKCSRDQYLCLRDHGLNLCDVTKCLFVWDEQGFIISCCSKRFVCSFIYKITYTYCMTIQRRHYHIISNLFYLIVWTNSIVSLYNNIFMYTYH